MTEDALEIVIKRLGIAACPQCPTQRLCPDPWFHEATAMCSACESLYCLLDEHAYDCPATCLTRLSQTCKSMAMARNPAEVQTHVNARNARKQQFEQSRKRKIEDEPASDSDWDSE